MLILHAEDRGPRFLRQVITVVSTDITSVLFTSIIMENLDPFTRSTSAVADDVADEGKAGDTRPPSSLAVDSSLLHEILAKITSLSTDVALVKAEQARRRRRESHGIVTTLSPPPRMSAMTDPSFARYNTPSAQAAAASARRASLRPAGARASSGVGTGGDAADTFAESDEDNDLDEEQRAALDAHPEREVVLTSAEQSKLLKIMGKMTSPGKFSGDKAEERDAVERWVDKATSYLDGLFGGIAAKRPQQYLDHVASLLEGSASDWLKMMRDTDPLATWDELRQSFVEHVRGGREARELWIQQMQSLALGRGKCRDLLSLESEFERFRVKLYPTSSVDAAMNERVGRDYSECIARGNPELYAEMLTILGVLDRPPMLMDWKHAAQRGQQILRARNEALRHRQGGGGGGGGGGQWSRGGRSGHHFGPSSTTSVNELSTTARGEADGGVSDSVSESEVEGAPGGASAQQMQGRRASSFSSRRPRLPRLLTDDEYRRVMELQLCLQCYKQGHRIGDAACREAGKPRRKPTAEELKETKA